jgi:hypothetical protein
VDTEFEDDALYGINQRNARQGAQVMQVESSRLTPLLVALAAIALLIAGLSLGVSWWATTAYREMERENRLLQLKVDEFRMALITANINPNPHAEGESK